MRRDTHRLLSKPWASVPHRTAPKACKRTIIVAGLPTSIRIICSPWCAIGVPGHGYVWGHCTGRGDRGDGMMPRGPCPHVTHSTSVG